MQNKTIGKDQKKVTIKTGSKIVPKKYNTQFQEKSSTVAKVAQIMALLNEDESRSDIDLSETSEDEGFHFDYVRG